MTLINLSPRSFTLTHEEPFLTIEFHSLSERPEKTYSGEYQGRKELARDELDILLAYQGPTLAEIYSGFNDLRDNLQSMQALTSQTSRILELLERQAGGQAAPGLSLIRLEINTFDPEPFDVLRPIPIVIQQDGEEFLAAFFDANVHTAGANEQEAFDNVRSLILDVFEDLTEEDAAQLGPEPTRQLSVLGAYMRKSE